MYTIDDILETEKYKVSFEYTLPTGAKIQIENMKWYGSEIISVCFPEVDNYDTKITSLEMLK